MTAVDVIVPTYGESTIRATVESVLAQRHPPARLVVINNGGPDPRGHLEGLEDHYDFMEMESNAGVCPAKNRAFRATSSPYVLFLHPDDGLGPTFLEETTGALDEHPDAAFATVAGVRVTDERFDTELAALSGDVDVDVRAHHGRDLLDLLVREAGFFVPSMTLMRRAHLDVPTRGDGPWDERLWSGHDYHLYHQLAARHGAVVVDAPLAVYRVHDSALSTDKPLMWKDRFASMQILLAEDSVVREDPHRREVIASLRDAGARRWALSLHQSGDRREAGEVARSRALATKDLRDVAVAAAVSLPGDLASGLVRRIGGQATSAGKAEVR